MIDELKNIEKILLGAIPSSISNLTEDKEAKEYAGCNFEIAQLRFKCRRAKITPKKVGQFVTLWKRNANNQTEPFHRTDDIDFCLIITEENENYGFFLFPKNELVHRQILSTDLKEGKRGFRVYPSWTQTVNNQAARTQNWQTRFFIDLSANQFVIIEKIKAILENT